MMRCVLISIKPKWCKLIIAGRKTLELRKSNIEPPFKCYIYCTKDNTDFAPKRIWWKADKTGFQHIMNGKVIGEFVCDYRLRHCEMANADIAEQMSCVSREDILKYSNGKEVFGWHISDLVIYDQPKPLNMFYKECVGLNNTGMCYECENAVGEECDCAVNGQLHLTRPPQSWCYVEECK